MTQERNLGFAVPLAIAGAGGAAWWPGRVSIALTIAVAGSGRLMLIPLLLAMLPGKRRDTRPDALDTLGPQLVFTRRHLGFHVLAKGAVGGGRGGAGGSPGGEHGRQGHCGHFALEQSGKGCGANCHMICSSVPMSNWTVLFQFGSSISPTLQQLTVADARNPTKVI